MGISERKRLKRTKYKTLRHKSSPSLAGVTERSTGTEPKADGLFAIAIYINNSGDKLLQSSSCCDGSILDNKADAIASCFVMCNSPHISLNKSYAPTDKLTVSDTLGYEYFGLVILNRPFLYI